MRFPLFLCKACIGVPSQAFFTPPIHADGLALRTTAQQRFAADAAGAAPDAAGAAPDLGAIFWRRGAPSLMPVGGGRQRRR